MQEGRETVQKISSFSVSFEHSSIKEKDDEKCAPPISQLAEARSFPSESQAKNFWS